MCYLPDGRVVTGTCINFGNGGSITLAVTTLCLRLDKECLHFENFKQSLSIQEFVYACYCKVSGEIAAASVVSRHIYKWLLSWP